MKESIHEKFKKIIKELEHKVKGFSQEVEQ